MPKPKKEKDIIIIGAGATGLTAALYAGRLKKSVLVLENEIIGGQIANAVDIENYPGTPSISGKELISRMQKQAEKFGAIIDEFDSVKRVDLSDEKKIIETDDYLYEAKALIIATGMKRRKLPLKEALQYEGKGIHYCELCDGYNYQGKIITVIGGGNAALDAANYLTEYAKELYLIHRSKSLRADEVTIKKLQKKEHVHFILDTEITKIQGKGKVSSIIILNKETNTEKELPTDAIFVNIGVIPNTHLFQDFVKLATDQRIIAGEDCKTNIKGVFAAGDVRQKQIRQLTTATSDGTTAALLAGEYIDTLKTT